MTATERSIFDEMCIALEKLGAQSDLLCIACSFGETLPDEMVLSGLRNWNRIARVEGPALTTAMSNEAQGERQ